MYKRQAAGQQKAENGEDGSGAKKRLRRQNKAKKQRQKQEKRQNLRQQKQEKQHMQRKWGGKTKTGKRKRA